MKQRITITLDNYLLTKLDKLVGTKKFASRSHAIQVLIQEYEN